MLIHVEYKPTITMVRLLRYLSGYTRVVQPILLIAYPGSSGLLTTRQFPVVNNQTIPHGKVSITLPFGQHNSGVIASIAFIPGFRFFGQATLCTVATVT
ncbi:MAG: hypothetical protein P8Z38_12605 [Robiginitalea sp.]